jgi:hypothetical protein
VVVVVMMMMVMRRRRRLLMMMIMMMAMTAEDPTLSGRHVSMRLPYGRRWDRVEIQLFDFGNYSPEKVEVAVAPPYSRDNKIFRRTVSGS